MATNNNFFTIKKNDTLPALQLCIIDRGCLGGKQAFNLEGVSGVTFTMRDSCGNYKIFNHSAQIISYSEGIVQYNWRPEDTSDFGSFSGEFQLLYLDGKKMTIPQKGHLKIDILKDIKTY